MPRIIKMAKGSYTATDITVDSDGRVVTASSGSGGQSHFVLTKASVSAENFTHAINPSTTVVQAYMVGGGGGGGDPSAVPGAGGGSGLISGPQAAPFSQPVTVGAGGPNRFDPGAATNYANFGTANGGQSGQQGPGNSASPGSLAAHSPSNFTVTADTSPGMGGPGAPGSPYSQQSSIMFMNDYLNYNSDPSSLSNAPGSGGNKGNTGTDGKNGAIAIYENIGA
mgnify:CR=1 FL=1